MFASHKRKPLLTTFKHDKLQYEIAPRVPNRDLSKRNSVLFYDGSVSNTMSNYVNHEWDPVFDPSAEMMVPSHMRHRRTSKKESATTHACILPQHPYEHHQDISDPLILDVPEGTLKMFRGFHDQFTGNPVNVGVGQSMTLGQ